MVGTWVLDELRLAVHKEYRIYIVITRGFLALEGKECNAYCSIATQDRVRHSIQRSVSLTFSCTGLGLPGTNISC